MPTENANRSVVLPLWQFVMLMFCLVVSTVEGAHWYVNRSLQAEVASYQTRLANGAAELTHARQYRVCDGLYYNTDDNSYQCYTNPVTCKAVVNNNGVDECVIDKPLLESEE